MNTDAEKSSTWKKNGTCEHCKIGHLLKSSFDSYLSPVADVVFGPNAFNYLMETLETFSRRLYTTLYLSKLAWEIVFIHCCANYEKGIDVLRSIPELLRIIKVIINLQAK